MLLSVAVEICLSGCAIFPEVAYQPVIRNPFPQLTKVAVAPFFNLSTEPTVDGRQFALAYFNELQLVPGYEVLPIGVVETTMRAHGISLQSPAEARRLAQLLGVDVVVVGAVTDFTPYYPPRCGLQVEWYAANPCFQPIPPGYGLPWDTPEEETIPDRLVYESQLAAARAKLQSQNPRFALEPPTGPAAFDTHLPPAEEVAPPPPTERSSEGEVIAFQADAVASDDADGSTATTESAACADASGKRAGNACIPTNEPVLRHTSIYNGHDAQFTEAIANFAYFRDDARFGGWQGYLERSDDFIRVCCHVHIAQMLSARGGAAESQVVWRWPASR